MDKTGKLSTVVGLENRIKIFNWAKNNPCKNQQDCAKALSIHRRTVGNHWIAIRNGWVPTAREVTNNE